MLEGGFGVDFEGYPLVFRPAFDDFFQFIDADFLVHDFAVFQVIEAVFVDGDEF